MEDKWDSMIQTPERGVLHTHKAEFSPDGTQIAVAYIDGIIGLWSTYTGKLQMTLEYRKSRTDVSAGQYTNYDWEHFDIFTFSSTGKLATAGIDDPKETDSVSIVKIWDPRTGELLRQLKDVPGKISSVAISPDCSQIALKSSKGAVGL